jgi:hypothetical protein
MLIVPVEVAADIGCRPGLAVPVKSRSVRYEEFDFISR